MEANRDVIIAEEYKSRIIVAGIFFSLGKLKVKWTNNAGAKEYEIENIICWKLSRVVGGTE